MGKYQTETDPSKVEWSTCPKCGEKRPYDWFGAYRYCWKCRVIHPEECANVTRTESDDSRRRAEKREAGLLWL